MPERVIASDGLHARVSGEWAERKLEFLEWFGPPALDATLGKRRRWYVDLFAGPGLNVVTADGGREFESGGLRALRMQGTRPPVCSFSGAFLVNLDPTDHASLSSRIDHRATEGRLTVPRENIHLLHADANRIIPEVLAAIHPKDYVLVFADPESPSQWPWASVEALVASGHESIDLYLLLPLEMGIRRLLNFRGGPHQDAHLTAYFGTEEWRPIADSRVTPSQSVDMGRRLEELYLGRLGRHWEHVARALSVKRVGDQGLYRTVFASSHFAGEKIASWAKRKASKRDQGDFFG